MLPAAESQFQGILQGEATGDITLLVGEFQMVWGKRDWERKTWGKDQGVMGKEGKVRRRLEVARIRGKMEN